MPNISPTPAQIEADVRRALEEDVGPGDLTASLVPADRQATATILSLIHISEPTRPY